MKHLWQGALFRVEHHTPTPHLKQLWHDTAAESIDHDAWMRGWTRRQIDEKATREDTVF
jgi:hypothetical protein